jgi:hypothetical protein
MLKTKVFAPHVTSSPSASSEQSLGMELEAIPISGGPDFRPIFALCCGTANCQTKGEFRRPAPPIGSVKGGQGTHRAVEGNNGTVFQIGSFSLIYSKRPAGNPVGAFLFLGKPPMDTNKHEGCARRVSTFFGALTAPCINVN